MDEIMLIGDNGDREFMVEIEAVFESRAPKEPPVGIGRGGLVTLEMLRFGEHRGYALYDSCGIGICVPMYDGVETPVSMALTVWLESEDKINFGFEGAKVPGAMGALLYLAPCWRS